MTGVDAAGQPGAVQVRAGQVANIVVSVVLLICVGVLVFSNERVRAVEAFTASTWLDPLLPGGVSAAGSIFMITSSPDGAIAFRITTECTSIVLIAPLMVFAAALLLRRGTSTGRVLAGTAVMVVVIEAVNQGRLGVIAWSTHTWGLHPGYDISHTFVGSVIGVAGFAIGLLLMLAIIGVRRPRKDKENKK